MTGPAQNRILAERPLPRDGAERASAAARKGEKGMARSVTVNLAESPLGWLVSRGLVTERQFAAGERLRSDWELAQIEPSTTMSWNAAPGRSLSGALQTMTETERQLAAKQRFDAAVDAAGPGLADVLWRVVCAGEGMRDAERALGWPARAGKLVLGLALDRIADFYRLN